MRSFSGIDGHVRESTNNALAPPRPIAPMNLSYVTTRQPIFRWSIPPEASAVELELCRDRNCAEVLLRTRVLGSEYRVPTMLPSGLVFWRLRSFRDGRVGVESSATWFFHAPAHAGMQMSTWGIRPDISGDGAGDLLVRVGGGTAGANVLPLQLQTYLGTSTGFSRTVSNTLDAPTEATSHWASRIAFVGDTNGDGFGDVLVSDSDNSSAPKSVLLFHGSPTGLSATRSVAVRTSATEYQNFAQRVVPLGDLDRDGYADFAVSRNAPYAVEVFYGAPTGVRAVSQSFVAVEDTTSFIPVGSVDFNGDGFLDLVCVGETSATNPRAQLYLYWGSSAGLSRSAISFFAPEARWSSANAGLPGDLNGDGLPDLAVVVGTSPREQQFLAYYATRGSMAVPTPAENIDVQRFLLDGTLGTPDFLSDSNRDGKAEVFFAYNQHVAPVQFEVGVLVCSELTMARRSCVRRSFGRLELSEVLSAGFGVETTSDQNGDGIDDLLLGQALWSRSRGRLLLFSGGESSSTPMAERTGTEGQFFGGYIGF